MALRDSISEVSDCTCSACDAIVLVCVAIRDLISLMSRVTVSAAIEADVVRVDGSAGVAATGGVDETLGVCCH